MDINMPIMNGIEATIELRKMMQQNVIKHCIIIAVSAQDPSKETPANCFDDYLMKPVSFSKLKNTIIKYIGGSNNTAKK